MSDPREALRLLSIKACDLEPGISGFGALVCPTCCGVGTVIIPPRVIACDECAGGGRRKVHTRDRADALEVDLETWRRTWQGRYEDVYGVLTGWDYEIRAVLGRQLDSLREA